MQVKRRAGPGDGERAVESNQPDRRNPANPGADALLQSALFYRQREAVERVTDVGKRRHSPAVEDLVIQLDARDLQHRAADHVPQAIGRAQLEISEAAHGFRATGEVSECGREVAEIAAESAAHI